MTTAPVPPTTPISRDSARPARQRRPSSGAVRERLVESAMVEFGEHGFEAASTRAIAARAGTHQPQINYHFDSKEALWQACVERLMGEFDSVMADVPTSTLRDTLVGTIRGLVHFVAHRPELGRVMFQEGTADSDRLRWVVEHHLAPRRERLIDLWCQALDEGIVADVDPQLVHYVLFGAATFLYTNAPEARLLGLDASDPDVVEVHADTLVRLLVRD